MIRIGQGYDVHRLIEGRRLVLGGVEIPSDVGLDGHSDADVLLHAITDAILGAVAAGDIGHWFPPSDERFRDADSADLLRAVMTSDILKDWRVVNLDATVVAEAPKLAPFIPRIRRVIADTLLVDSQAVSVKATTTERLGALGRGEGMAAMAVVLMSRV
ncbi:MAG: 2-C-methyl-D-erythritol 2,4-cyclodiphosphate synthase [Lentisphaeria bacterium]|nr:2-C-methyl-D-erythritol 2,4-cyclodiphosphate synthase [Lentisphaeria bacterium]